MLLLALYFLRCCSSSSQLWWPWRLEEKGEGGGGGGGGCAIVVLVFVVVVDANVGIVALTQSLCVWCVCVYSNHNVLTTADIILAVKSSVADACLFCNHAKLKFRHNVSPAAN